MTRLPPWSAGPAKGERPDRPFTGYKLAHAVVSADGARTGFAGLTLGATRVYGVLGDACCVWNRRHAPPRRPPGAPSRPGFAPGAPGRCG